MRHRLGRVLVVVALASLPAHAESVTRVSVSFNGSEGGGRSMLPALSGDGRYVAFVSAAPYLTPDDGDAVEDVFVHDRVAGTTVLVSRATGGAKGNAASGDTPSYAIGGPTISADGRFVAFTSQASNLVVGVSNQNVYVHDRDADGDGIFDESGAVTTRCVSLTPSSLPANGFSRVPAISGNGRFVAFTSTATDLVFGDTNGVRDIFVRDRDTDGDGIFDEPGSVLTERVSIATNGAQADAPSGTSSDVQVSFDGSVVVFLSEATNLVPFDQNGVADIFLRDRTAGTTVRMNVSSTGAAPEYYPTYDVALSGDGRFVAFSSQDTSLAGTPPDYGGVEPENSDVFVRDRLTGITKTWADGAPAGQVRRTTSYRPALSYDGRFLAFFTRFGRARFDGEPESNDVELYVHDRSTKTTSTRSIQAPDGSPTTVLGRGVALSSDGRTAAFDTEGAAIVPGDGNGTRDVFVASCPVVVGGDPLFTSCDPIPFATLGPVDRSRFAAGEREFREVDTPAQGLGPVFNATSCAECHHRPWIGGTSDHTVTRIGTTGPGGFDALPAHGGPVLQTDGITTATCSVPGETLPAEADIVATRDPPALFGAGLIDAVPDAAILRLADPNDRNGDDVSGRAHMVGARVGRFGHKAQIATLVEFAGDAYLTEMGITSPGFPTELAPQGVASSCDPVPDPEDDGANVARFVDFLSLLAPLPSGRYPSAAVKREALVGRRLFRQLGCRGCHSERLRVPTTLRLARGLRRVELFTDLLLHDMGPGLADGIVQGDAGGSEFRTPPLAGVAFSGPYLHDGRAGTLDDAILAHGGEATAVRDRFAALSPPERALLRAFLRSL